MTALLENLADFCTMKTTTIRQTVIIKASPDKVYKAFLSKKKHQDFTGYKARINDREGEKFTTCGGRNFGYNLFLKPGKRIIQAWSHRSFQDDQYSIIDITLTTTNNAHTKLLFQQTGAPKEAAEWLIPGWKSTYWDPLKQYLEKGTIQKNKD
jgi:activator of HSP90 ATPase